MNLYEEDQSIDAYVRQQIAELNRRLRLHLAEVAFTSPNKLPAAFTEVVMARFGLEMMRTVMSMMERCMDRLEDHLANKSSMSF